MRRSAEGMAKGMANRAARCTVVGLLLLPGLASFGCAHNHEALERQLQTLREEIDDLKRTDRSVTVRLEDVENRVLLVQDRLETRQTYLYRDRGEAELPTVRLSPGETWGRAPEPAPAPAPAPRGREPLAYSELDAYGRVVPLGTLEDPPVTITPDTAPILVAPAAISVTPAPSRAPSPEERELNAREERRAAGEYKKAYALVREGRYSRALTAFQRFLDRYPGHPLADNALYWMGECHYAQKSYLDAIQLFQRVIQDYPEGNKVPDAMLKTGLCYGNLGEVDQARRVLRQVAEIYPRSRAAGIALEHERAL